MRYKEYNITIPGICLLLTVIMVGLKFAGQIGWDWLVVLAPLWGLAITFVLLFGIQLIIGGAQILIRKSKRLIKKIKKREKEGKKAEPPAKAIFRVATILLIALLLGLALFTLQGCSSSSSEGSDATLIENGTITKFQNWRQDEFFTIIEIEENSESKFQRLEIPEELYYQLAEGDIVVELRQSPVSYDMRSSSIITMVFQKPSGENLSYDFPAGFGLNLDEVGGQQ